jgi:hypothetical protein
MKLKYPLKIGDTLYPKGTPVKLLSKDDYRVKQIFPNMKNNPESNQVAIIVEGRDKPIIHVASGIE